MWTELNNSKPYSNKTLPVQNIRIKSERRGGEKGDDKDFVGVIPRFNS